MLRYLRVPSVEKGLKGIETSKSRTLARFRYRTWIHLGESLIQGALTIFMFIVLFILTSGSIKCNIVRTQTMCYLVQV